MQTCTFFGHKDCPDSILPRIQNAIEHLIVDSKVHTFYVGNQGRFDTLAVQALRKLKTTYPHINLYVVLAYLPGKRSEAHTLRDCETLFPDGLEYIHPRYAISWRNKWMLARSDYVITYISHAYGGAEKFSKLAAQQKKTIINLAAE